MRRIDSLLASRWTKVVVFLVCLVPLGLLGGRVLRHDVTANPIEFVEHWFGDWTLRFLLITLAVTPLRKLLHLPLLVRYRRLLGLYAFFYATLHFLSWVVLDHFFAFSEMWADVLKRRYITVGFTAFVLLIPLAVTSTRGWIRRLGGKRWQRLHQAVYAAAVLGVVHYYWLVKSDVHKPLEYAAVLALLLGWRIVAGWRKRRSPATAARSHEPVTAEDHLDPRRHDGRDGRLSR